MTQLETATVVLMAAVVVILSLWDLYVKVRQPNGKATISWQARALGQKWPIIAFVAGMVVAHFWWFNCPPCKSDLKPAPVIGGE